MAASRRTRPETDGFTETETLHGDVRGEESPTADWTGQNKTTSGDKYDARVSGTIPTIPLI